TIAAVLSTFGNSTFDWSGTALSVTGTWAIMSNTTASFTSTDDTALDGTGKLQNLGELNVNVGAATCTISIASFDNNGTVNVDVGTMVLSGTGTSTHWGTFNVVSTLSFNAGTHTLKPSSTVVVTGGD